VSGSLNRPWALFAPLPATMVGVAIAGAHGISWVSYAPNLLGLLLGIGLFYITQRGTDEKLTAWMPGVAAAAIFATLLGPGIDGVYRWLSVGPLRLNASSALAPWLLIGVSASGERLRTRVIVPVLVAQVAHAMQPDAGQATALAAGLVPLLVHPSRIKPTMGIPLAFAVTLLAAAAWLRHDPLPAVITWSAFWSSHP
jgi:cell division protein FtsW (lipid II flippase)